jgi:hypothetical protein
MPWIDELAPAAPFNLSQEGEGLHWEVHKSVNEMDRSRFFVLYRYKPGENIKLKRPENIVCISGEPFVLFSEGIKAGVYRVSALDRLNNESQLSEPLIIN